MRIMCIITDITEYIVVDEALTDSEMLHEYLCEHSVDDYTVTFTNWTLEAELKTQRDELINNVQELINNVDMTHTKDHFYCESCNGTGACASGEICEDCGGYGTTFKWWADDAPGFLHD